ncbi:hypothetical protein Dsin_000073 [Dipteronia sinensis]|uniref:Small auxin up regulated protein n=1 Tax=Dipteronia sinensis TaxID=43782 RepID=A0AAD9YZX7_9ROSI|nr:hypothetical protein Dsin_000073 [Dipteronia sinensis]
MMSGIMKKLWSCGAKSFPSEGHVLVYVGKDMQFKFEMEANYLNHPLFDNFSEEELGFSYDGALRLACEIDLFHYLLHLLNTSNPSAHYMDLSDLISNFYKHNPHHSSIQ